MEQTDRGAASRRPGESRIGKLRPAGFRYQAGTAATTQAIADCTAGDAAAVRSTAERIANLATRGRGMGIHLEASCTFRG